MTLKSINPATGELLRALPEWDDSRIEQALSLAAQARTRWAAMPLEERAALLRNVAGFLRERRDKLARLVSVEMGKLIGEARAEVEKCAAGCEHYAARARGYLADETVESDAGRSYVAYQPLGTVLAVMPWNFPFWQVFRFAAPALMAGNTALLKHASNVSLCADAIRELFEDAGFPQGVFIVLPISSARVERVIADRRIDAVTLTGSDAAGRSIGGCAGAHLKKSVLELGGSDPFVVLADAELDATVATAVTARFQNAGQSCIAAKRFIVVDAIADAFLDRFGAAVEALVPGDPLDEKVTLAPLARHDLRDGLHAQVSDALSAGARAVTGCAPLEGPGAHYRPSILEGVGPGMRAWREELFGPVAIVVRAADESEALQLANDTPFGLGGSVWTGDPARGERFALAMQCGLAFVNGLVKSDPRLPFGGVKQSGYGRELSRHGIREFTNAKTVWIR